MKLEECPLQQNSQCQKRPHTFKGPLRVVRLCILGIALPTALISLPLYLRYHVYANQLYPFAVSDMRLLDRRISTIWCQKQLVKVNATFNAFLLSQPPHVASDQKQLSMVRDLLLEDDMKEYWGYYLLNGSTVTVSTCVRWPGASLTIIRGHKHLHECAYIGDDSSEELDELLEAVREGIYVKTNDSSESDSAFPNAPQLMKRHHPDVVFHHPLHNNTSNRNHSIRPKEMEDTSDITDPKLLKSLLDALSKKAEKRDRNRQKLRDKYTEPQKKQQTVQENPTGSSSTDNNNSSERVRKVDQIVTDNKKDPLNEAENMTSSEELFREVSRKLDALGDRQHKVLEKLNARLVKNSTDDQRKQNHGDKYEQIHQRRKRDLIIATALLDNLNSEDEERDAAIEEGFTSDGIADHRGFVNETTLNDMSNSEFWSSFSSSEEALLNCEGLILNLPLTPHPNCQMDESEDNLKDASLTNTITYLVPKSGYYFFVFNSENEVQVNYIRIRFQLNKTVYDVSHPVSSCANTTEQCALDLGFFSEEKMVMEVPVMVNESRWNDEFVVVSECEPRTLIYMCCVLSVPVLILLFAFQ